MTIKFTNIGRYKLNWSVEVGNREMAPVESEIVNHVLGRKGAINTKLVTAIYDEVKDGEDGSPSIQRKRTGYITAGRRKVGKFEVQT